METNEYKINGVTFKVGDVVTAYQKGIHRITKITRRFYTKEERHYGKVGEEYSPIVETERILNSKFKPQKGKDSCDMSYCRHFTVDMLRQERDNIVETYNAAITLLTNQK